MDIRLVIREDSIILDIEIGHELERIKFASKITRRSMLRGSVYRLEVVRYGGDME